jgi:hypothetical protein
MTMQNGRLFDGPPLPEWLEGRRQACLKDLGELAIKDLLDRPIEVTVESLLATLRPRPVVLRQDDARVEEARETRVFGSGGMVSARVRTGHFQPGYCTTVRVPFDGDAALLLLSVPGISAVPPVGFIESDGLHFRFEWLKDHDPRIDDQLAGALAAIESPFLERQTEEVEAFNLSLGAEVAEAAGDRRDGHLQAQQYLVGLQIPVYRRADAPETFAAPGIERRPAPTLPIEQPGQPPEPILVEEFYEHIIEVISAMARAMERAPGDYATWDEEKLRDALLVILNTHYSGGATGETFNKGGKVDILVRVADRNVFVGECKWWKGPKSFADPDTGKSALDQLLSYTTWRDAKLALAIFVGNKELSGVIDSAQSTLDGREDVSKVRRLADGQLRTRVRLPAGGEADLAIVFVHLPDA